MGGSARGQRQERERGHEVSPVMNITSTAENAASSLRAATMLSLTSVPPVQLDPSRCLYPAYE